MIFLTWQENSDTRCAKAGPKSIFGRANIKSKISDSRVANQFFELIQILIRITNDLRIFFDSPNILGSNLKKKDSNQFSLSVSLKQLAKKIRIFDPDLLQDLILSQGTIFPDKRNLRN